MIIFQRASQVELVIKKESTCQCRIHKRCRDASQVYEKDIPGLYNWQQAGRRSLREFKLLKLNC